MLKKLYRYELRALYRTLLPAYALMLGVALVTRFAFLFDAEGVWFFEASRWTMVVISFMSAYALMIVTTVIVIIRFYKHLLTREGYLTFSLPVSTATHIFSKLIAAMTVALTTTLVALLSLFVLVIGTELWQEVVEFMPVVGMFFRAAFEGVGAVHMVLYILEVTVALLLTSAAGFLMYYACMAIGQQFRGRVGAAILTYFIISFGGQMVSSMLTFPLSMLIASLDFTWIEQHIRGVMHAIFLIILLITGAIAFAFWKITHHFLSKKLNLE